MNLAPVLKKSGQRKKKEPMVPTEYKDANGHQMVSWNCDMCAPGRALPGCSVCRGTGVYTIRKV